MKQIALSVFAIIISSVCSGQVQKIWDHTYGGTFWDYLTTMVATSDSGMVLGGYLYFYPFNSFCEISEPTYYGNDMWIIKINSAGVKQWDRRIGGSNDEELTCMIQVSDGGYLVGGYSDSGISGTKTEPCWGLTDYWVVRLDANGTILWDKRFGGNNFDVVKGIMETEDEGFLLLGFSESDISGNVSEDNINGYSWIVKIDSTGNLLWERRPGADVINCGILLPGGNYLIGGEADESLVDISEPAYGLHDFWVEVIDKEGNKIWDKRYGGNYGDYLYRCALTSSNEILLAGTSGSPPSGNKSAGLWNNSNDYWILLIDTVGIIKWDKNYGGTSAEIIVHSLQVTPQGDLVIGGISDSDIGGDKTEDNLGPHKPWVVILDSSGNIKLNKTLITLDGELNCSAAILQDGNLGIATYSNAPPFGEKSEINCGDNDMADFFAVKYNLSSIPVPVTTPSTKSITVFPNPTSGLLWIDGASEVESGMVEIFTTNGEIIHSSEMNFSEKRAIDMSHFSSGIYGIKITSDNQVYISKFGLID